jgi:nitrogen regulatory protein P-II 2
VEGNMKIVSAVIKHVKLQDVQKALSASGVQGITITEVKGFGRQKGFTEIYRGIQHEVKFLPKVKVEVAVPDEKLDEVVSIIEGAARTGEVGDGKIFVYELLDVVRIRTGERGKEAL